jgi:hypothetical protein
MALPRRAMTSLSVVSPVMAVLSHHRIVRIQRVS